MLIKGAQNSSNKKVLFGGYCSKPMPAVPTVMDQDQDYPVALSPEDFLFCWVEGHGVAFFKVKGQYIIEFFTDYEQGGAISMGMDFMLISNSFDFSLTVGNCSQAKSFKMNTVPNPTDMSAIEKEISNCLNNFTLETSEIWTCSFNKKGECQVSPENLKQKITSSINSTNLTHPWNNILSPYNFFRARSVFQVP